MKMLITLALTLALAASPLHAVDIYDITAWMKSEGIHPRATFKHGFLYDGASTIIDMTLVAGRTYTLVAADNNDARTYDVDVEVYDGNWRLVASDVDSSDIAEVNLHIVRSGIFHVKVTMAETYRGMGGRYLLVTGCE